MKEDRISLLENEKMERESDFTLQMEKRINEKENIIATQRNEKKQIKEELAQLKLNLAEKSGDVSKLVVELQSNVKDLENEIEQLKAASEIVKTENMQHLQSIREENKNLKASCVILYLIF